MIYHHLLVAFRALNRYKFYTIINVLGLAVGITACLVILLFIRHELSYDRFNVNSDRIYRVDWDLKFGVNSAHNAAVTPPMAEVLVQDYPEIEAAARFRYIGAFQFKKEVENIVEGRVVFADNDIFRIFTIPFVAGNPSLALKQPNTMVITEQCAAVFFPDGEALGQTLIVDNKIPYKITGVVKDLPDNSHFHYRIFLSMEGLDESRNGNWIGGPFNTYLMLRAGADAKQLEAKLPAFVEKYVMPNAAVSLGETFMEDFIKGGNTLTLRLRPLTDIHLYSHLRNELEGNGDIRYVYLLGAIAVFILLIACINFMNLSTARSVKRAREVGVRKVMGSSTRKLAVQFITESVMLCFLAFIVALCLATIALPVFNALSGIRLTIPLSPVVLLQLTGAAVIIGILSGLYPGFVLSAFRPAEVLKGSMVSGHKSSFFRSGLVVFQFTISIALITATLALYRQMTFIQNHKLGFDKEGIIVMRDVKNAGEKLFAFRDKVLENSFVHTATISSYLPGPGSARKTPLAWKFGESPSPENSINLEQWEVDYEYAPTLGLEIIEGRNFSMDFPSDSSAVILNEAAVQNLGLVQPVGARISLAHENPDGSQTEGGIETWTIIGVVRNFNFESLRQNVGPLGLFFGTHSQQSIAFRYEAGQESRLIEVLREEWKEAAAGEPFNYTFFDQNLQSLYGTEQRLGRIFIMFSVLAIVIACLGLFALTAFSAEQRTKEIGIRKVLGASARSIVLLLSWQLSKLVVIGFVIAAPLAAYGIDWYLQQYAYRTEISVWLYGWAGLIALLLAFLTMAYQSSRAALSNPIDALKSE